MLLLFSFKKDFDKCAKEHMDTIHSLQRSSFSSGRSNQSYHRGRPQRPEEVAMIAATSSSRSLQTKLSQMYTMHFQKSLNVVNNTQEVACTELKRNRENPYQKWRPLYIEPRGDARDCISDCTGNDTNKARESVTFPTVTGLDPSQKSSARDCTNHNRPQSTHHGHANITLGLQVTPPLGWVSSSRVTLMAAVIARSHQVFAGRVSLFHRISWPLQPRFDIYEILTRWCGVQA